MGGLILRSIAGCSHCSIIKETF